MLNPNLVNTWLSWYICEVSNETDVERVKWVKDKFLGQIEAMGGMAVEWIGMWKYQIK